jgi:hypothetical protein
MGKCYENKFMVSWSISVVLSFFTGLIREIINELKKNYQKKIIVLIILKNSKESKHQQDSLKVEKQQQNILVLQK